VLFKTKTTEGKDNKDNKVALAILSTIVLIYLIIHIMFIRINYKLTPGNMVTNYLLSIKNCIGYLYHNYKINAYSQ